MNGGGESNSMLCNWIPVAGNKISSDNMDPEKCCCVSEILIRNVGDVFQNIHSKSSFSFF